MNERVIVAFQEEFGKDQLAWFCNKTIDLPFSLCLQHVVEESTFRLTGILLIIEYGNSG